jgi:aspartyl-tRNA(Asn)/glutamyl-tRNA(Gln) amidotransferase subunit A
MSDTPLHYRSLAELVALIRRREVSSVEVTRVYLDRAEALNESIGAYILVDRRGALASARKADRVIASGDAPSPLTGVPLAIKDIIHVKDVRTTSGSKVMADYVASEDSTLVERLRATGAVLLGKLNLSEFAIGGTIEHPFGTPKNPWDISRATGGSSSGSAVAVAAGLCAGALGSDTGGSIRGPASFCGIVGIRPTSGRVTRHGVVPMSWSYDTIGPMTRTVEDCALVLQAIAGHDPRDASSSRLPVPDYCKVLGKSVQGMRLGLPKEMFDFDGLEAETKLAVELAVKLLVKLGATTRSVSLPTSPWGGAIFLATADVDAAAYHREWQVTRGDDYDWSTRVRLESASLTPATAYIRAQRARVLVRRELLAALSENDALVLPTTSSPAPTLEEGTGRPGGYYQDRKRDLGSRRYMSAPSVSGLPAISVPCGFTKSRLPIGLQLIGKPFDEGTLFRVAHAYEQAAGYYRKHPPL